MDVMYVAGAWARIVPYNPFAFPPSVEVMYRSDDVQDVMSGFLLQANPKYLHPCRQ